MSSIDVIVRVDDQAKTAAIVFPASFLHATDAEVRRILDAMSAARKEWEEKGYNVRYATR